MRILIVSERLSKDFDDGIKNIALNLLLELREKNEVKGMSEWADIPEMNIKKVVTNRWYSSTSVRDYLRDFKPDLVIYVPWTSATIRSLIRLRMMKFWSGGAKTAIVATQPMPYPALQKAAISFIKPDIALAMSQDTLSILRGVGIKSRMLRAGVNPDKFFPRTSKERVELRDNFRIPQDVFLVTHVGHLKKERFSIEVLGEIAKLENTWMMVVGSPHTPAEEGYIRHAEELGIHIYRGYLDDVSQIYRMSDLYLFPVSDPFACVGIPLSIIEALSCSCPVVSTDFQGMPAEIPEGGGIRYADSEGKIIELVTMARNNLDWVDKPEDQVKDFTWKRISSDLMENL
jgi:glycosyltransferase involved in cell wall biosynthesis